MQDAPRVFTDSTAGSEVARLHCVMIKWNLILERLQLPDHLYTDKLRCHIPRPGPVSLRVSELVQIPPSDDEQLGPVSEQPETAVTVAAEQGPRRS